MFNKGQFKTLIEETLKEIDMYSEAAVNLLLGTAAQESKFGTYLTQLYGGPALGVFQMEPATHEDIWQNYLIFNQDLLNMFKAWGLEQGGEQLVYDLKYAIIMARLQYYRRPEPLPSKQDIPAMAKYYKLWYNTPKGKATEAEFIENYRKYVGI